MEWFGALCKLYFVASFISGKYLIPMEWFGKSESVFTQMRPLQNWPIRNLALGVFTDVALRLIIRHPDWVRIGYTRYRFGPETD